MTTNLNVVSSYPQDDINYLSCNFCSKHTIVFTFDLKMVVGSFVNYVAHFFGNFRISISAIFDLHFTNIEAEIHQPNLTYPNLT